MYTGQRVQEHVHGLAPRLRHDLLRLGNRARLFARGRDEVLYDEETLGRNHDRRDEGGRDLQQDLLRALRDLRVQASAQGQGRVHALPVEGDLEAQQGRRPDLERGDVAYYEQNPGGEGHHVRALDHDRGVEDGAGGDGASDIADTAVLRHARGRRAQRERDLRHRRGCVRQPVSGQVGGVVLDFKDERNHEGRRV